MPRNMKHVAVRFGDAVQEAVVFMFPVDSIMQR
jgi:hypothetical protein